MNMNEESVYVIPTWTLSEAGHLADGFTAADDEVEAWISSRAHTMRRSDAELDPTHKQLIPYAVVVRGDSVFVTERLRGGVEARLHGFLSIGVGGHVDGSLEAGADLALRGLRGEWSEEVEASWPAEFRFIGLVNDDAVEVGRVHIGLVYVCYAPPDGSVIVRESEKLRGRWAQVEELRARPDALETWSREILLSADLWW